MINVKNIKSVFSIIANTEEEIIDKIDQVRFYNGNYEYYLMNIETQITQETVCVTDTTSEFSTQIIIRFRAWFAKIEKNN